MLMYHLIEYSDNYSGTIGSFFTISQYSFFIKKSEKILLLILIHLNLNQDF